MKSILTERLDLLPLTQNDAEEFFKLQSDPDVMRYIKPPATDIQEVHDRIKELLAYSAENEGYGIWMAHDEELEEIVGWCCLIHIELDTSKPIEIGYRLHKKHWGKGYATEMAKVLKDYADKALNVQSVVGITHPENTASANVLEKIGLSYIDTREFYGQECSFYA